MLVWLLLILIVVLYPCLYRVIHLYYYTHFFEICYSGYLALKLSLENGMF